MGIARLAIGLWCAAAVGACMGVSGGGPGDGSGGQVDAAMHAADSGSGGHVWIDASTHDASSVACVAPQTGYGTGEHNTGKDCLGSCHNHGFTLAGTLYTSATNNSGYPGATVTIVDANGASYPLVVMANGNFYSSANIAFPVTVSVSDCPYTTTMTAKVTTGGCNSTSCHAQSGSTQGQIHLP